MNEFADLRRVIDKVIDWLNLAKLQKWCFVAGTSIMTPTGAVAVEQICSGMMVWCAPEDGTGAACYRPVLETYQNRADAIYHIRYDHDGDSVTPEQTLSASAEHPVWVEESGTFVPVAELNSGLTLRMANGRGGRIGAVTAENTAPRGGTPVFNFAVAEHHTYFAGLGGVWVHNLCPEGLDRMRTKYLGMLGNGIKSKDDTVKEILDWMQNDKTAGGFTEEDMQQAVEYLFSKAIDSKADDMLRSNPASYFSHKELLAQRGRSGIDGNALNSHHLLSERFAPLMEISDPGDIIAVALSPKWHQGVRKLGADKIIGEGSNINALINNRLVEMGASKISPTKVQCWQAHKQVYDQLGRTDWAKAIHSKYFQPLGIEY